MQTSAYVVYAAEARTRPSGKLDGGTVVVSFAAFLIGTFMIAEAIALWAFHSVAGWPGAIAAIVVSTVLTVVFRNRMRTTNGVKRIADVDYDVSAKDNSI
jgi:hypothetical protein